MFPLDQFYLELSKKPIHAADGQLTFLFSDDKVISSSTGLREMIILKKGKTIRSTYLIKLNETLDSKFILSFRYEDEAVIIPFNSISDIKKHLVKIETF